MMGWECIDETGSRSVRFRRNKAGVVNLQSPLANPGAVFGKIGATPATGENSFRGMKTGTVLHLPGRGAFFAPVADIRNHLKPHIRHLAWIAPALGMLACAPPKAIVVQEAPASKPLAKPPQETSIAASPALPEAQADGIRLPDMLGMPGENEFRTSRPASSGAVIARPPASPGP
jgi:hypothetical protein